MPLDVQAPLALVELLDHRIAKDVEMEHTQDRALGPQVSNHRLLRRFGDRLRANSADNNKKSCED
jgi:hypothetical protein